MSQVIDELDFEKYKDFGLLQEPRLNGVGFRYFVTYKGVIIGNTDLRDYYFIIRDYFQQEAPNKA